MFRPEMDPDPTKLKKKNMIRIRQYFKNRNRIRPHFKSRILIRPKQLDPIKTPRSGSATPGIETSFPAPSTLILGEPQITQPLHTKIQNQRASKQQSLLNVRYYLFLVGIVTEILMLLDSTGCCCGCSRNISWTNTFSSSTLPSAELVIPTVLADSELILIS